MDYPIKKGKPSYAKQNEIWPSGYASTKNPAMQTSLFNENAFGGKVGTDGQYAKKGKGATVNKSVFKSKTNELSPTINY